MSNNKANNTSFLTELLSTLGEKARSCKDVRHCSRCNLPLTDFSSWERGIGPICAKKDTHLFAKTIPANFPMATAHAMSLKSTSLPAELVDVWEKVKNVLLDKTEHAMSISDGGDYKISGEDCRLIVRIIDWMNSFKLQSQEKQHLIQIVKHLGYPGLAGVISGVSSTGAAELKFSNGMLYLTGSRNKAGFNEMCKIPKISLPRSSNNNQYSVPVGQYKEFINNAIEFWPCFNGEINLIVDECEKWIKENPNSTKPSLQTNVKNKPLATFTESSADFGLKFDWDSNVSFNLVNSLKEIPYQHRKYDPITKIWTIKKQYKDQVVSLFKVNYEITNEIH